MSVEKDMISKIHDLSERIYQGDVLSPTDSDRLLAGMNYTMPDHEFSFALGALASSGIPGAEAVIASFLSEAYPIRRSSYALSRLCSMGLCQKYRSQILAAFNDPLYMAASSVGWPRAQSAAIYCMGQCLSKHHDPEYAAILFKLILAMDHLPSAASQEFTLGIVARQAAVAAMGGDNAKACDDKLYEEQCVARFLAERRFG